MRILGFIGLDGASWHIISSYDKCFKNLLRIAENSFKAINLCFPPYTPPSWITIFTGVSPYTHKILGFMKPYGSSQGEVKFKFYTAYDVKYPRLPEILAMEGFSGITVNHPLSFPVQAWYLKKQILVSDDTSPCDFIYPREYSSFLKYFRKRKLRLTRGETKWLRNVRDVLEKRIEGMLYLVNEFNPDFLVVVFKEIDTIIHYLPYVAQGVFDEEVCMVFKLLDDFIDKARKIFKHIVIASDHGFNVYTERINLWFILSILSNKREPISRKVLSMTLQSKLYGLVTKWLIISKKGVKLFYSARRFIRKTLLKQSDIMLSRELYGKKVALDPVDGDNSFAIYVNGKENASRIVKYISNIFKKYVSHIETLKLSDNLFCIIIIPRSTMHFANDPKFASTQILRFAAARHSPYGMFLMHGPYIKKSFAYIENVDVLPTILHVLKLPLATYFEGKAMFTDKKYAHYKNYQRKWILLRKIYWIQKRVTPRYKQV